MLSAYYSSAHQHVQCFNNFGFGFWSNVDTDVKVALNIRWLPALIKWKVENTDKVFESELGSQGQGLEDLEAQMARSDVTGC